jgi:UPF0271 protein
MGADAAIMPHISSANIACGGHAGDPSTMRATLRLARAHRVTPGAHPGFPDIAGFGRRVVPMPPAEIADSVLAQVGALAALARAEGLALAHVKPHGALYHHAASVPAVARALAEAIAAFDAGLAIVTQSGSVLERAAQAAGLRVAREAFADRAYEPDGTLRGRQHADSMILDYERNLAQALSIVREGCVVAHDGSRVPVMAETLCLHGDAPGAGKRAAFLRRGLEAAGVTVAPLGSA